MIGFFIQKPSEPPAQLFTDLSEAIASVTATKKLYVSADLVQDGLITKTDLWVQLPGQITAICKYPNTDKNRPTVWKFHLTQYGMLAVDPLRQWYLRRNTSGAKEQKALYDEFLSEIPPPTTILASPGQAITLFTQIIKGFPQWKRSMDHDRIVWKGTGKVAYATLQFSKKSKRIIGFSEKLPLKDGKVAQVGWSFVYHDWKKPPEITAPAHYIRTGTVTLAHPYPNYGKGLATELARRSVDFYDAHHDLKILASPGKTPVMIVALQGELEVVSDQQSWAYRGGSLTWKDKGGENSTAKIPLGQLPDALQSRGLPNSRLISTLLGGHNFAIRSFLPNYEGKVVGSIVLEGTKVDLVQLRGPAVQVLISVEEQTGFIREIESTTYDRSGTPLSKIDEKFQLLGTKM